MGYYGFTPVSRDCVEDGNYFQLRYDGPSTDPGARGREADLSSMWLRLLCNAALAVTGESSLWRAGCKLAPDPTTARVWGNRWSQLARLDDYTVSQERKNGAVRACKRDLSGRSAALDALIDDEGPLWLLVSRTIWSLEELERLWVRIAGTDVASPPLWTDGEIGLDEKWYQLVEGALDFGAASIASATTLFFCMRRAQAIGSPYDYAMCYYGILGSVHRIVMEAESGPCVDPQCRFVDKSDIDCLILAEFWRQLGCFVEAWHSRIRVFSNCRDTFDLIAVGLAELIPDVVEASCLQGGNIVSERDFHPERCAWPVFSRQGELAFTVPRNPEAPRNWLYRPLPFPYPFRDTFP